jgi:hypothetical protein
MRAFWRQWRAQIEESPIDEWADEPGASRFPSASVYVK